jgi:Succinylglutamate desuccinylase / Aspartoacylase family
VPDHPASHPPALEVLPRDLSAYKQGNIGIDYVHRFESGKPGPHVLINALTHGNEFCGMSVLTDLLDRAVRPLLGTLTLSFSNIEAYESFDPARPFESRQIVHNFNRIWDSAALDGGDDSPELRRARILRPVFEQADHLLDFHSTSTDVEAFWVYNGRKANGALASSLGLPSVHMMMPAGALIATDGPEEIRALCDDCTILMPARQPQVGREAVYLTRPMSDH